MESYLLGKCLDMCPVGERKLREKERLLHVLEVVPGTENTPNPKADKSRAVKSFSRSAAGRTMQKATDLRPPDILLKTVHYLINEIVCCDDLPWPAVYEFAMDRLRAVRQDLVIQNVSYTDWISILQPIVKFHAYAAYRLCPEDITKFDPALNKTHLQECLKRLLSTYDATAAMYGPHVNKVRSGMASNKMTRDFLFEYLVDYRPDFECLYLVLNLGNEEALMRALSLPKRLRTGTINTCIDLSLNYKTNNFIRTCRLLLKLTPLVAAVASLHLPEIRKRAFMTMSVAYSSKQLKVPIETVQTFLLYDSKEELCRDCEHYGIDYNDSGINFNKASFKDKDPMKPTHRKFVDDQLAIMRVSTMLLY